MIGVRITGDPHLVLIGILRLGDAGADSINGVVRGVQHRLLRLVLDVGDPAYIAPDCIREANVIQIGRASCRERVWLKV